MAARDSLESRRLRIAAIGLRGVPSRYSGLETSAGPLYRCLAERGHEITVYCRERYLDTDADEYQGIRLRRLPAVSAKSVETLSHVAASLADALLRGGFDLLHTHALAPGLFSWLRRFSRTPIVATVQGLDWRRSKWRGAGSSVLRRAERMLVRYADELIVVSRDLEAYFEREHSRRSVYIPNGVDRIVVPEDLSLLPQLGLEPERYVVYIGRLVPEKRVEDLIVAFRAVPTPYRLVIAGEAGYTSGYVAHLREQAAGDSRVLFTGLLRGAAWAAIFSQAAAFVLPSEVEGLPVALLECMELGVPAIVSDIPPHRELLGWLDSDLQLVPPGDVDRLANSLRQVLSHLPHFRSLAEQARLHVRRHFGWPHIAAQTESVYLRAIARASPVVARSESAPTRP